MNLPRRRLGESRAVTIAVVLALYVLVEVASSVLVQLMFPGTQWLAMLSRLIWFSIFVLVFIPRALSWSADHDTGGSTFPPADRGNRLGR